MLFCQTLALSVKSLGLDHMCGVCLWMCAYVTKGASGAQDKGQTSRENQKDGVGCEPTHMVGSGEAINQEELDMGLHGCTRFLLVD